jgi:hypothetical protein
MNIQGHAKIPGYLVVGSGFDPAYMQPRLSIFDHEDGFASPTFWKNPFYPQHEFAVPSTLRVVENTNTVEKNITEVAMSKNEYETQYSHRSTKRFALGFGKRTTSVYHYYYRFEAHQEYKLEMERMLSWYDVNLRPGLLFNPEKYVTPAFKAIMDQLGTNCNDPTTKALYRMVIQYYGTHLVTGVTMGGSAHQEVYFKKELLDTRQISEVITQSSFSFFGLIKIRGYDLKKDKKIADWFKGNTTVKSEFIGGRYNPNSPTTKEPWEAFVETLRTDPGVLHYDIVPLATLFKDPKKHECMARATDEYLREIAANTKYNY